MTQTRPRTNKLEWLMILKISLRAKAGVPKTLVKQKLGLNSQYFHSLAGNSVFCNLFLDFERFAIVLIRFQSLS